MSCLHPSLPAVPAQPASATGPSTLPLDDVAFEEVIASMMYHLHPTNFVFNFQPWNQGQRECVSPSVNCGLPSGEVPLVLADAAIAESFIGGLPFFAGASVPAGAPSSVDCAAACPFIGPLALPPHNTLAFGLQQFNSAHTIQPVDCLHSSSHNTGSSCALPEQTPTFAGRYCSAESTQSTGEIVAVSESLAGMPSSDAASGNRDGVPQVTSSAPNTAPTVIASGHHDGTTGTNLTHDTVTPLETPLARQQAPASNIGAHSGRPCPADSVSFVSNVYLQDAVTTSDTVIRPDVSSSLSLTSSSAVLLNEDVTSAEGMSSISGQVEAAMSSTDTDTNVYSSVTSSVDSGVYLSVRDYFDLQVAPPPVSYKPASDIFPLKTESQPDFLSKTRSLGYDSTLPESEALLFDLICSKGDSCAEIGSVKKAETLKPACVNASTCAGSPVGSSSLVSADAPLRTKRYAVAKDTRHGTEAACKTNTSRRASHAQSDTFPRSCQSMADVPKTMEDLVTSLWSFLSRSPFTQVRSTGRPNSIIRGLPQTREQFDACLRLIQTRETTLFPRECQPFEIMEDPPRNFGLLFKKDSKCLVKEDPRCQKRCTCATDAEHHPQNPLVMTEDNDKRVYYVVIGTPKTEDDVRRSLLLLSRPGTRVVLSTKQQTFRIAKVAKVAATKPGERSPQRELSAEKHEVSAESSRDSELHQEQETEQTSQVLQSKPRTHAPAASNETAENETVMNCTHGRASPCNTDPRQRVCCRESNTHTDSTDSRSKETTESRVQHAKTKVLFKDAATISNRGSEEPGMDIARLQKASRRSQEGSKDVQRAEPCADKTLGKPGDGSAVPREENAKLMCTHSDKIPARPLEVTPHSHDVISSFVDTDTKEDRGLTKETASHPQKTQCAPKDIKQHHERMTLQESAQMTPARVCSGPATSSTSVDPAEQTEIKQRDGGPVQFKENFKENQAVQTEGMLPRKSRFNFRVVTVEQEAPKYIYPYAHRLKQQSNERYTTPEDVVPLKNTPHNTPKPPSNTDDSNSFTELQLGDEASAQPQGKLPEVVHENSVSDLSYSHQEQVELKLTSQEERPLAPFGNTSPKALQQETLNDSVVYDPLPESGCKPMGSDVSSCENEGTLPPKSLTPCTLPTILEKSDVTSPQPDTPINDLKENIPPGSIGLIQNASDDAENACVNQVHCADDLSSVNLSTMQPKATKASRLPVPKKVPAQKPKEGSSVLQPSQAQPLTEVPSFENSVSQTHTTATQLTKGEPAGLVSACDCNKLPNDLAIQDNEASQVPRPTRFRGSELKRSTSSSDVKKSMDKSLAGSKAESRESVLDEKQRPGNVKNASTASNSVWKTLHKYGQEREAKTAVIATLSKPSVQQNNPGTKSKLAPLETPKTVHTATSTDVGSAGNTSVIIPMLRQKGASPKAASYFAEADSELQLRKGLSTVVKLDSTVQQRGGNLKTIKALDKPKSSVATDDSSSFRTCLDAHNACIPSASSSAAVTQEPRSTKDSGGKSAAIFQTTGVPVKSSKPSDNSATQTDISGTVNLTGTTKGQSPPLKRTKAIQCRPNQACGATSASPTNASKCDKSMRAV